MKTVIIGGVAAGTKAAARIGRLDRNGETKLLTKSSGISYAECALPYYVGGVINDRGALSASEPASFSALTGTKVVTGCEVTSVDFDSKTVKAVKDGEEITESYDRLVIASGASPIVPDIAGVKTPGVFFMRTPDNAVALREYIEANGCRSAVIAGAGFIGLETAENLKSRGLSVTVIDVAGQILSGALDRDMADYAASELRKSGMRILTGTPITAVLGSDRVTGIEAGVLKIDADVVVIALGVKPATSFLDPAKIAMADGAVIVDENMRTSVPDVYAAGDCAEIKNTVSGKNVRSAMGSTAGISARILADNVMGGDRSFRGVLGTAVVKLARGLNAARTGLTVTQAKMEGIEAVSATCVVNDKPAFYPGADSMVIKLIASASDRRLIGAEIIGAGAVDKIADTAAVAITAGMKADELCSLDLAYAPPFSTAVSPFVTAVNVLLNKLDGVLKSFTPEEYSAGAAKGYTVVDVHPAPSVTGAKFVDISRFDGVIDGVEKDAKLLIVCHRGRRAYIAQRMFAAAGYTETRVLEGGSYLNRVKVEFKGTLPAEEIKRLKGLGFLQDKRFSDHFNLRVITRNGKITSAEHRAVAEAADRFGSGEVTMTTRLTLEIQGIPYSNVEGVLGFLADNGLETGGTGSLVRPIVSCKGTTCQYGLLDSFGLSEKLHERFYIGMHKVTLPHKFKIAVGGCPNNCVKPSLNDLGIIGQRVPSVDTEKCRGCRVCQIEKACPIGVAKVVNGKVVIPDTDCNHCGRCVGKGPFGAIENSTYGYRVYIGGRWGKKVAEGQPLSKIFHSEDEVMDLVERAILFFRDEGITGERFSDTIARLGFDYVEDKLLYGNIDKDAVLGKTVIGGAKC
ncbi:MAG: FAD-dependent oxidoreductase [Clostridia bacterium]|nr:FAD-dependent oxidoreductase [Clostridia bacterium]